MSTSVSELQTCPANDKSTFGIMKLVTVTPGLSVKVQRLCLFFFASEELAAGSHLCLSCPPALPKSSPLPLPP